jgi:hypothetical protein
MASNSSKSASFEGKSKELIFKYPMYFSEAGKTVVHSFDIAAKYLLGSADDLISPYLIERELVSYGILRVITGFLS